VAMMGCEFCGQSGDVGQTKREREACYDGASAVPAGAHRHNGSLATERGGRREGQGECDHSRRVVGEFREAAAVCDQLGAGKAKARAVSLERELERVRLGMQRERSVLDRLRGGLAASSSANDTGGAPEPSQRKDWMGDGRREHAEMSRHTVRPDPCVGFRARADPCQRFPGDPRDRFLSCSRRVAHLASHFATGCRGRRSASSWPGWEGS
jgi:hypothetical protein